MSATSSVTLTIRKTTSKKRHDHAICAIRLPNSTASEETSRSNGRRRRRRWRRGCEKARCQIIERVGARACKVKQQSSAATTRTEQSQSGRAHAKERPQADAFILHAYASVGRALPHRRRRAAGGGGGGRRRCKRASARTHDNDETGDCGRAKRARMRVHPSFACVTLVLVRVERRHERVQRRPTCHEGFFFWLALVKTKSVLALAIIVTWILRLQSGKMCRRSRAHGDPQMSATTTIRHFANAREDRPPAIARAARLSAMIVQLLHQVAASKRRVFALNFEAYNRLNRCLQSNNLIIVFQRLRVAGL